jgi:serine/threonine protein kinase
VIWKWLRHPNIVPFKFLGVSNYFLGISNYFPVCLVSEWMPEGTVSSFFDAHPDENRLPYVRDHLSGV